MGLSLFKDETGKNGRQYTYKDGRIDLLCVDAATRDFVVIELKKGEAPHETLLQILRYMSWVRQHLAKDKDVRGIILSEAADTSLIEVVKEVPSVEIRYYRLSLDLLD